MIKDFSLIDLKDTINLCLISIKEKYPEEIVDKNSIRKTLKDYLSSKNKGAFVYIEKKTIKGILAYSVNPKMYNHDEKILSEDFLLIHPDNKNGMIGLKLINIFLIGADKLKDILNIKQTQVVFPNDENTNRIEKFYNKKNFKIVEVLAERKENVL